MTLLTMLLVQLFWFSFLLPGLAMLVAYPRLRPIGTAPAKTPLLTFFLALGLGLALYVPFIAIAYIFELALVWLAVFYFVVLLVSAVVLMQHRQTLARNLRQLLPRTRTQLLLTILIGGALALDYIFALHTVGPIDCDAPVQISKIAYYLHSHLSFADPYFGENGVLDFRYSANVLNAFYALGAKFFGISAPEIWQYSCGFFRLIIWTGFFGCIWHLAAAYKQRRLWAYGFIAAAPFIIGPLFTYVQLPDRIVLAWIALLLIGLKELFASKRPGILVAASLLIASTHAIVALFAAGYLIGCGIVLGLLRQAVRPYIKGLALSILILAVPVAANLAVPNHITNGNDATFNAGAISHAYTLVHAGGLAFAKLPDFHYYDLIFMAACLGIFLARRINNLRLKVLLSLPLLVIALLCYSPFILAVAFYGLLLYYIKDVRLRVCIGLLIVCYSLVIYNPLLMTPLEHRVPPWFIARLGELNALDLIATALAPIIFIQFVTPKRLLAKIIPALPVVVPGLVIFTGILLTATSPGMALRLQNPARDQLRLKEYARQFELAEPQLHNQIVLASLEMSNVLPFAAIANVVAVTPTGASPMSNGIARATCNESLVRSLNAEQLATAGVTRVAVWHDDERFAALAKSKSYLTELYHDSKLTVFGVNSSDILAQDKSDSCYFPHGE